MTPEEQWWDELEGDEVFHNAWGNPPYDAVAAARLIDACLRLKPGDTVLDLGCGPGRTALAVAGRGPFSVVGVDVSGLMIAFAHMSEKLWRKADDYLGPAEISVEFFAGNGRQIPDSIDFNHAYSITMFEHIPRKATVNYMRQVYDRLPDGGGFVFTHTPGFDHHSPRHHQCGAKHMPLEWAIDVGFTEVGIVPLPDELEAVGGWVWYEAWKR